MLYLLYHQLLPGLREYFKTINMKAVAFDNYGPPEVLHLIEIEKPTPSDNELLIKVHATAVNSGDIRMRKADPFLVRFMLGLFRPAKKVMGLVFAGEVEAVGNGVTKFQMGDKVYGTTMEKFGANAEYLCLPETGIIAKKAISLSYEEAAVIPFGGATALHFLRLAGAGPGKKILIYGASGAVGTATVQLAKYFGAVVTGVCSTSNVDLVKSLGADHVIDYTKETFTLKHQEYDILFDTVGKSPFSVSVSALKKNGFYLRAVHLSASAIIRGLWVNITSNKKVVGGVAKESPDDLVLLNQLVQEGRFKPVIDKSFSLAEMVEAHRYVESGHKKGNVAISVTPSSTSK
jgi:NADPH:quinone reductase-like Zn-dependent oxidoreductase